jgi:hypothetical protein
MAAVAGAVSATVAFAALYFSANQNAQNAAALSLASAQKFSDECRELWRNCRAAVSDCDEYEKCMEEILGSFELFSLAVNEQSLTGRVSDYIVETICDYLEQMSEAGCHDYVRPLTDKAHVCKELKSLVRQHRTRFRDPLKIGDMLNIPRSSMR